MCVYVVCTACVHSYRIEQFVTLLLLIVLRVARTAPCSPQIYPSCCNSQAASRDALIPPVQGRGVSNVVDLLVASRADSS
eukprot:COSAG01_NODE_258_length_20077_cov_124.162429_38_plen_80_part_00